VKSNDIDEFAELWRSEESEEEQRIFRALARRVGWKAKALEFLDYGLAGLLIISASVAIWLDRTPATVATGSIMVAGAVWLGWKRRLLHQVTRMLGFGSREEMLEAAIYKSESELRQALSGILLFPIGIALSGLMKFSAATEGDIGRFPSAFFDNAARGGSALLALIVLAAAEIYFVYRSLQLRRERKRLIDLREQYRLEARRDRALI
jgi:hypothetical protein